LESLNYGWWWQNNNIITVIYYTIVFVCVYYLYYNNIMIAVWRCAVRNCGTKNYFQNLMRRSSIIRKNLISQSNHQAQLFVRYFLSAACHYIYIFKKSSKRELSLFFCRYTVLFRMIYYLSKRPDSVYTKWLRLRHIMFICTLYTHTHTHTADFNIYIYTKRKYNKLRFVVVISYIYIAHYISA